MDWLFSDTSIIMTRFENTSNMELQKEVHGVGKEMKDHDMERVMEMVG